jgi:hypothetical protein
MASEPAFDGFQRQERLGAALVAAIAAAGGASLARETGPGFCFRHRYRRRALSIIGIPGLPLIQQPFQVLSETVLPLFVGRLDALGGGGDGGRVEPSITSHLSLLGQLLDGGQGPGPFQVSIAPVP